MQSREERRLTDLVDGPGLVGSLTTDGIYVYFVWTEIVGDLGVMNVMRE